VKVLATYLGQPCERFEILQWGKCTRNYEPKGNFGEEIDLQLRNPTHSAIDETLRSGLPFAEGD